MPIGSVTVRVRVDQIRSPYASISRVDDELWHAIEEQEHKVEQEQLRKLDSSLDRMISYRARLLVVFLPLIAVLIALHLPSHLEPAS